MKGTISIVDNHDSIFILWIELEDGCIEPVYLDHRAFGRLAVGEGIERADDLIGLAVYYNGDAIEFLDSLEAA